MGSNGRFSDGFLMGALVGGAAVFLLGTEKGNKLLKIMVEEGRAGINDLMDEIEEYQEVAADDVVDVNDEEVDEIAEIIESTPKTSSEASSTKSKSSSKRFFRKK
jgi:gas vesicle protein